MRVEPVPCLSDNYAWIAWAPGKAAAAVIDPGEASPVLAALERLGLRAAAVLLTHHHADHVGGAAEVARAHGAAAWCSEEDAGRVPLPARGVADGEAVEVGPLRLRALAVPGHTRGHLAWVGGGHAFVGDALFSLGCGRLFEGSPEEMWRSLARLRALPDDTLLCCGHEYTLANARFAEAALPGDPAVARRAAEARALRAAGRPTLPVRLDAEAAANPFLRADEPAVAAAVGLTGAPPERVFAELRARKDRFRG